MSPFVAVSTSNIITMKIDPSLAIGFDGVGIPVITSLRRGGRIAAITDITIFIISTRSHDSVGMMAMRFEIVSKNPNSEVSPYIPS